MQPHAGLWAALPPDLRDRIDELLCARQPPWPEAAEATTEGQAVAAHLGVPFFFASPAAPDIGLPHWWDGQGR
ncbi:hypothetical protein Daura_17775 [Dactylosporangium aurantiacum]|uniref:Uncharacterized protein n=1 Tax=Dactylosporangium aurantiacum TaxID=35754 RepID=A0A9Q9MKD0_9ACTN|nr:hypothetical protein [Dactylosporangium aurantiacum]MDG6109870.1 hypothetical protein [Dactylosporangium aurantiacum]UWZ57850.1 hypothetical protein Daura_17775 [Dactylosporangium aurantiacum]